MEYVPTFRGGGSCNAVAAVFRGRLVACCYSLQKQVGAGVLKLHCIHRDRYKHYVELGAFTTCPLEYSCMRYVAYHHRRSSKNNFKPSGVHHPKVVTVAIPPQGDCVFLNKPFSCQAHAFLCKPFFTAPPASPSRAAYFLSQITTRIYMWSLEGPNYLRFSRHKQFFVWIFSSTQRLHTKWLMAGWKLFLINPGKWWHGLQQTPLVGRLESKFYRLYNFCQIVVDGYSDECDTLLLL